VIANKREEQTPSCGGKKKRHSSSMFQVKLDVANTSSLNEYIYDLYVRNLLSLLIFGKASESTPDPLESK
jgi:hypothetical protein